MLKNNFIFTSKCFDGCSQGILTDSDLSFRLSCQLGEVIGLAFGDVVLALLQSLLGLVPSLLGDLLLGFLGVFRISGMEA